MRDIILDRRSIRSYTGEPLEEETVPLLLEAAFQAPTSRGLKPWHFIVLDNPEHIREVTNELSNARPAAGAAVVFIVCGDKEISPDYYLHDCAAATMNILLKAHELGLGSLWCAVHPNPIRMSKITELFSIPSHIVPFSIAAVGHTHEDPPRPDRYDAQRVHRNKW